jgi:uncharacterized membrane protein
VGARYAVKSVLPYAVAYLGIVAASIVVDLLLHDAGKIWVGRYLGIVGTVLLLLSFLYSLRKRKLIERGSPKALLRNHEVLGWISAVMLVVHGGVHFNSLIPWLAVLAMLVVIASGFTGQYLLKQAKDHLKQKEKDLKAASPGEDFEDQLIAQSLIVDKMKEWRRVHMPLTMVFASLVLLHLASLLFFWRLV